MPQVTYQIEVSDSYTPPTGEITSDLDYVAFVMNMAARSYKTQYQTATVNEGISAARAAYNAALPPPVE